MAKTAHAATGQSVTISGRGEVLFYVDFTTGTGVGSAQLEVKVDGDWLPASEEFTADMDAVQVSEFDYGVELRWNVTRASGTITTYLS